MDKRLLLCTCSLLQALSLCLAALTLYYKDSIDLSFEGTNLSGHLCFSLVTLFLMLYTIGPGTVPFVLMAELCPPHVSDK